jgi:hypothetical protein
MPLADIFQAHRGYLTYMLGSICSILTAEDGSCSATYWWGRIVANIVETKSPGSRPQPRRGLGRYKIPSIMLGAA